MLARAGRGGGRLVTPQSFAATCEQLYLPWLCPAYGLSRQKCRRSISIETGSNGHKLRKRRNSGESSASSARRSLATAVEYRSSDAIPFEGLSYSQIPPSYGTSYRQDPSNLSHLRYFDPTKPLTLGNSLALAAPRHRISNAVGGDIQEIISVLEACLQVGRVERAGVIIRRIATYKELSSDEMARLHNKYLRVSLERLIESPSNAAAQALHKWFELEIRMKGITINAETLTYMLKTSLQSPPGKRQDRLVRRYMDMAPGDMGLEVLSNTIMSAEELNRIAHIASEHTFFPDETLLEDDMTEQDAAESLPTVLESCTPELKVIPEVRPVHLKGLGLKALKQALSLFSDKPAGFDGDRLSYSERRERQTRLEEDAVSSAIDRWREEHVSMIKMGIDSALQTKSLGARMWRWQEDLDEYIRRELVMIDEAEMKDKRTRQDIERCVYGPFLRYLPVEKLAAVTILTTMTSLSKYGIDKGVPLSSIIMSLGHSIEDESISESIVNSGTESANFARFSRFGKRPLGRTTSSLLKLVKGKVVASKTDERVNWDPQWPSTIKAKIGAFLISALVDTAKVPVTRIHPQMGAVTQLQPAFSHAHRYKMGKRTGMILANNAVVDLLKREPVHSLLAKHLPMVVEPEPWTKFNSGGFVLHPAKVMRIKLGDKDQRCYAEAAVDKGDMEQIFKGLDVLGKTSWKINQPVFDTMLEAWNSGEAIANFPPENPDLETPPEPEASKDPTERRRWIRAVKTIENARASFHSQRCFQNFQLEIARALRDETFYFPHNVDFRGRAYPIPPYLNHMGADHCRGLLRFGTGKELGDDGLRWLKIHLANVYGFDKASLKDRENFAVENIKEVFDSATNPLKGNRWWLKAEDPWQCLGACFELKAALDCKDPARYISYLPIHQDGTCNGLQHYAALGGDEWGAKQVNLEPGDRPADVYSAVANLVKESLAKDLESGHPCAKILDGKITRKVVKQTVMTNVYGVTFIGAQAQVRRQLVAAHPDLPSTPEMHSGILASYVATKIFKALSTMFRGAHDIQFWLGECASRISKSVTAEQLDRIEHRLTTPFFSNAGKNKGAKSPASGLEDEMQFKSCVVWTTPLRMPVVQPYRASKSKIITTNLQKISLSDPHRSDPVNKRKQLQAFPPNFIHSLDASHMILSALRCEELGLSFAAVHDSFWTHAADVSKMNGVLREAFIRMHSEDIIGRLGAEFNARYTGHMYLSKIKAGTEFHKRVDKWRRSQRSTKPDPNYSFPNMKQITMSRLKEALLERRRMRLLSSSDPEEVEKGRAMVTPGSIFEELTAEADLANSEELSPFGLGDMPGGKVQCENSQDLRAEENIAVIDEVDNHLSINEDLENEVEDSDSEGFETENSTDKPAQREDRFAKTVSTKKRRTGQTTPQWAWLPMKFPPIPKKGDFDVSRLKNSQYFFS